MLRLRGLLRAGLAAPLAGFARAVDDLRAALVRLEADVDDFARVELALRAPAFRVLVERFAVDFRAPPVPDDDLDDVLPAEPSSATFHLPDITRWAASATASAISEPSLVALAIMLVAACDAVSAASRPASRMARRAFGLALIAAAAAARPAASISLLIAALASLSTVSLPEEVFLEDLAIASSPFRCGRRHFKPVTVPELSRKRLLQIC